jgi:hypothetical protein
MPPFSETFKSVDPTRGILFIDDCLIFLPWVKSIEPLKKRYPHTETKDPENKCVVVFHNGTELVIDKTTVEVYDTIKKFLNGEADE